MSGSWRRFEVAVPRVRTLRVAREPLSELSRGYLVTIGISILIAAVGAVLRYAVADHVDNIDLRMVGLILMIAGAAGLVAGIVLAIAHRRDVVVDRPGG